MARPTSVQAAYETSVYQKPWFTLIKPARSNPAENLLFAQALDRRGKLSAAARQYRLTALFWPTSPEAPQAHYSYAEALQRAGNLPRAFTEYQHLLTNFTAQAFFDDTIARQFEIAKATETTRRGRFLFLPGFPQYERAAEMYEQVARNAPEWEHTAEAFFRAGRMFEKANKPLQAINAYMSVEMRFPQNPFCEEAAFGRVRSLMVVSREEPNNSMAMENVRAAAIMFERRFPQSSFAPQIAEIKKSIYERQAEGTYEMARFYERSDKPRAAVFEYRNLAALYPDSHRAAYARRRIEQLQPAVERETRREAQMNAARTKKEAEWITKMNAPATPAKKGETP